MKFHLIVSMDNDEFHNAPKATLVHLLKETARKVKIMDLFVGQAYAIQDVNGNCVGEFYFDNQAEII